MGDADLSSEEIVHLAFDATDRDELRQELLRRLVSSTGSLGGLMAEPETPVTQGMVHQLPVELVEQCREPFWRDPPEVSGLAPLLGAIARHGAILDTSVYPPHVLDRLPARQVIAELGIKASLCSLFSVGRGDITFLCLADTRGQYIGRDNELYVQRLVPALAVAMAAIPVPADDEVISLPPWLTERQQEICLYVMHGYTNREIATACGISLHTVRNHLVKLFRSFGATTRTELASQLLLRSSGPAYQAVDPRRSLVRRE